MVSGTKWPGGDPFLQRQNEGSIAVSSRNPLHLLAGANDYRTVDLQLIDELPSPTLTGDAWLGLFKSFNGGQTWQSTLIPGYPQDLTTEGLASPLKGFTTGSDPVVRSGTNGLFYYAGIAFNRTSTRGAVFVSRYIDLNNRENGNAAPSTPSAASTDPIRYAGTFVVESTSAKTEFLDKPWIAVDLPRQGAANCTLHVAQPGGAVTQSFPAGNVYIVYTKFFLDALGKPIRSELHFSRSRDCGAHWSAPFVLKALDESKAAGPSLHQGAILAVDPQAGFVYAAWRRFKGAVYRDSILAAASIDGGRTFTPGIPLVTLPAFDPNLTGYSFFDQGTTGSSFRTNAFPALAVDDSGVPGWPGRIYLAWSQRFTLIDGVRHARIMMLNLPGSILISSGGISLKSFPIDDDPLRDDANGFFKRGHQFMPQLTFAGGKLLALYYDMRLDHSYGTFAPGTPLPPDSFVPFLETRVLAGELPASPGAVFTPFVDDANLTKRRHTLDVIVGEADPSSAPVFTPARVSRYKTGVRPTGSGLIEQLQVNPPGLPLFKGGTAPFVGDYLDIAAQTFVPKADGTWSFNTAAVTAPFRIAVWTSNQDVRAPPRDPDGKQWERYTPVGVGTNRVSIFDPGMVVPNCLTGREGMRNQNIYSANITEGLLFSAPQNSKPLSSTVQRAFVVVLQNFTGSKRAFLLAIANQPAGGGFASFVQAPNTDPLPAKLPPPTTTLQVTVGPRSAVARSVFAISGSPTANPNASIKVTAAEMGGSGVETFLVLNPDGSVPPLIDPEGAPAGSNITFTELYNPDVANPDVANPNENKSAIPNPDVANPDVANPDVANPDLATPDVANPDVANPDVANVNVMNPDVANPDVANPLVSDATYMTTNNGNTAAAYDIKLVGSGPGKTLNAPLQLIVNKSYRTPVGFNCYLREETQNTLQSNVREPVIFDPADISTPDVANATLWLLPGETGMITLRGYVALEVMEQFVSHVTPVVVAQAANTGEERPRFSAPLTIITTALPDAILREPYGATLQAIGGTPPYRWEIRPDDLPGGVTLSLDGVISGTPDFGFEGPQTFPFRVRVTDDNGAVQTADFSITVVERLGMWTPWSTAGDARSLPIGTVGNSYFVELLPLGGTPPYTWSQSGLPAGMEFNPASGAISGTPTATGFWAVTLQIADSSHPAQQFSADFAFKVIRCFPDLPAPTLEYLGSADYTTQGEDFTRYNLSVTNYSSFPDELFETSSWFGRCGDNLFPSRSWVDVFDDTESRLYGFCALGTAQNLTQLWFGLPRGTPPPNGVYIVIQDNACIGPNHGPVQYRSNTVHLSPDAALGSIAGFVRDSNTNAPVEGATVKLYDPAGQLVGTVVSDPGGAYRFDNLPPGEYSIEVFGPPGHGDGVGTIPVFAGRETAPILFQLFPTGAVSGQVIDGPAGFFRFIAGATVTVTGGPVAGFSRTATTNEFGSYFIPGLNPGMFTVQVTAIGYPEAVQTVEVFETVLGVSFALRSINGTWTVLSAGGNFSCGILTTGDTYCWGRNDFGQLGAGPTSETCGATPCSTEKLLVGGNLRFTSVSAGAFHACGVTDTQEVWCWGRNHMGQLGNGTTADTSLPVQVLGGLSFTSVSAGELVTCGVTTSGVAACWGERFALGTDSLITETCSGSSCSTTPVLVDISGQPPLFKSVSAGADHVCGVTAASSVTAEWQVLCWGRSDLGALGDGNTGSSTRVTPTPVLGGFNYAVVDAGFSHTCAITTGNAVNCWGSNQYGELGVSSTTETCGALDCSSTPVAVSGGLIFLSVNTGSEHTCGVSSDLILSCWGRNANGQLGNGTFSNSSTPVAVAGGRLFESVSAGGLHTCAIPLAADGYAWGSNGFSEVGVGTVGGAVNTPTVVPIP
jgi:alpha-tubulin suppressor-like RCC1 family protein